MRRISQVIIRKRIWISLLVGILVFLALIFRLGYIQLVKGSWFTDKAEDLWSRDIPVEAKRGTILDRNGNELAYNISSPTVIAIPVQIKDAKTTAMELASILNMSEEKIYKLITKKESGLVISS